MTARLKLEKRRLEISHRLDEIRALPEDKRTEGLAREAEALEKEDRESRAALLAAIESEERDMSNAAAATNDGEGAELRELRGRVNFGHYVTAAAEQRAADGAALEYNQALGIAGNRFPLALLAPAELRAETGADGRANQSSWIDRLFAETLAMYLGITFESVAPGVSAHPVTTAGATGAQKARMEAATAAAWTVATTELRPKRNVTLAVFSSEDAYRLPGLEAALTRDMRMAVMEAVDAAVFKGDTGADGTDADIAGLQTLAGTEKTVAQANKVKADQVLKAFLELVDGKHAGTLADVRVVSSIGSNVLWGTTIHNSAAENETVAQFLMCSGLTWRTREGIDMNTANGDFGAYVGLQRGIMGAGVAAVWSSGELIRDMYTGAGKGEVNLTLATYWDFALPRASNFARLKYVT